MALLTKTHDWAMIRLSPVEVIPDDTGEPRIFMLEQGPDQVGCVACDAPLTSRTMNTECSEAFD